MNPYITAIMNNNGGVISRAEAMDAGMSPSEIRHLVRRRTWVAVRRGVYARRDHWESLDDHVGKPRLQTRAAILTMTRGWVVSHDSAAHELGLLILTPKEPLVHVTRPGWTNAWTRNGIAHHLARFHDWQVVHPGELPTLDLARTAVDIARCHDFDAGLVACDGALRMGVKRSELMRAVEPMAHWKGAPNARDCIGLADPGAANPNESLGRGLVLEAGIGEPETQFPLMTARGLVWCDIRVGNLIIETDGRIKYRPVAAGGVADKPVDQIVMDEKKRERLIRDEGLVVVRLWWEDYWGRRRQEAIRRLQSEYADACARFGERLSDRLAQQAAQIRREYAVRRDTA